MQNVQLVRTSRRHVPARSGYRVEHPAPPPPNFGNIFRAHRAIFAASVFGCILIAALYSFSSSPVYQARGSLELQVPPAASFSQGDGASSINGQTYDSYLETQIGILQSDSLIRRVITRLNLVNRVQSYHPTGLAAVRGRLLAKIFPRAPLTPEAVFQQAKSNLTVRQSRLNDLIEILYDANDPKLAADFINTLADEYEQQNLEARWQVSQSAGNWFTRHLADLQRQMEQAENKLQEYSRENNLLLTGDNGTSVAHQRLSQLQDALSRAQSELFTRQAQMEMAAKSDPDAVPEVMDNAALKDYEVKISDLERQLAEDSLVYTPKNPKILLLKSQISSLQAAFKNQRSSVLSRVTNEYNAALRNEQMLNAAYTAQTKLVHDQDEKMIRYDTLKHEVDSDRQIYESLLQKVKESSVSVALQATNVRVVDGAVPPSGPYKPNHVVNLGLGTVGGLIMGFTLIALRHRSDRRVHHPGTTQHYLAARELGVIPSRPPSRYLGLRNRFRAIENSGLRVWLDDPNSLLSTSFRSVMTSIVFATRNQSRTRLVVVTSPGAGEGKTTIASNLAAAFAATGRRVLLVDADLRRPRLRKVFDLPETPGLREFAEAVLNSDGVPLDLERFVQPAPVPDLFVMSAGANSPDASNLIFTQRFEEVFAEFRKQFDTVLVDAPPLLCVPEARVMARLADGVVLVVRAGATSVDAVMAAENYVREDGGIVIGTVLNDAPQDSTPYYSQYTTPSVSA
jgi:polysaccharide biosynthesis transport protein